MTEMEPIIQADVKEKVVYDALGNKIVIGNAYGYSQRSSGCVHIVVGIVTKITPTGMVSLTQTKKGSSVYNDVNTYAKKYKEDVDRSTVVPNSIFPLANTDVSWGEYGSKNK